MTHCHKACSHGNTLILHLGVDPWNKGMWLDFDGICWRNFGNRWLKEVLIYIQTTYMFTIRLETRPTSYMIPS